MSDTPNLSLLPANPSLEQLKNRAKTLLRAAKAQDGDALTRIKVHFSALSPDNIKLANALFVVAREHGFTSWPKLRQHIEQSAVAVAGRPAPLTPTTTNEDEANKFKYWGMRVFVDRDGYTARKIGDRDYETLSKEQAAHVHEMYHRRHKRLGIGGPTLEFPHVFESLDEGFVFTWKEPLYPVYFHRTEDGGWSWLDGAGNYEDAYHEASRYEFNPQLTVGFASADQLDRAEEDGVELRPVNLKIRGTRQTRLRLIRCN